MIDIERNIKNYEEELEKKGKNILRVDRRFDECNEEREKVKLILENAKQRKGINNNIIDNETKLYQKTLHDKGKFNKTL